MRHAELQQWGSGMAQGITNRTALGLAGGYTDMNELGRDVKRGVDRLPFGSFGFQATNTTATPLPAATTTVITFDTMLQDRETWVQSQVNPFSAFIVPDGGSGVYALTYSHRLSGVSNGPDSLSSNTALVATASGVLYVDVLALPAIPFSAGEQFDLFFSVTVQGSPTYGGTFFTMGLKANGTTIALASFPVAANTGGTYSEGFTYDPAAYGATSPMNFTLQINPSNSSGFINVIAPYMVARRTQRTPGQVLSVIQVNNLAVTTDDSSSGLYGSSNTMQWLSDGDVISAAVVNNTADALSLAADPIASAIVPYSPILTATRIALL